MGRKQPPADGMTFQPETKEKLKNHNPNDQHNAKKVSLGQNTKR